MSHRDLFCDNHDLGSRINGLTKFTIIWKNNTLYAIWNFPCSLELLSKFLPPINEIRIFSFKEIIFTNILFSELKRGVLLVDTERTT